ncbi:unnamed protein product [Sphagnum jensenii]|uniref:Secreted protein n=1 Tax=Sphagnum jensenii TaxID=128206 RepID=A0ABP0ZYQ7_9BRYO
MQLAFLPVQLLLTLALAITALQTDLLPQEFLYLFELNSWLFVAILCMLQQYPEPPLSTEACAQCTTHKQHKP